MKKIFLTVLTVLIATVLLVGCGDSEPEALQYTQKADGTYAVNGIGTYTSANVAILPIYNGQAVTAIEKMAFYNCQTMQAIVIPNSITSIGDMAFSGCTNLVTISFIGTQAEWDAIEKGANWDAATGKYTLICTSGAGTTTAGDSTSIPTEDEPIDPNAPASEGLSFEERHDGNYIVSGIGECNDTKIVIPSTHRGKPVVKIRESAFYNCTQIVEVFIPSSVKTIGQSAFKSCSQLASVTISNGVTSIEYEAFEECYNLSAVMLPSSVSELSRAFRGCTGLASLTVATDNSTYRSEENCIIEEATDTVILGCKNSVIPSSVKAIGEDAFAGCDGLTAIVIPGNVTEIGYGAFAGCSKLSTVTISDGLKMVGDDAFGACDSLVNIIIPDSVTTIGNGAFSYCENLESVTLSRNLTNIPNSLFMVDKKLKTVSIPNSITSIGDHAFYGCSSLASVKIPDGVTSIGHDAFVGCSSITELAIPKSVTNIGLVAIGRCDSLVKITVAPENAVYRSENNCIIEKSTNILIAGCNTSNIPSGVTAIGRDAFYGCPLLESVVIPSGVTVIGEGAFQDCRNLRYVAIPSSVTVIDKYAFYWCSLGTIYFDGSREQWNAIEKGENWDLYSDGYTLVCEGDDVTDDENDSENQSRYDEGIDILFGVDVDYWAINPFWVSGKDACTFENNHARLDYHWALVFNMLETEAGVFEQLVYFDPDTNTAVANNLYKWVVDINGTEYEIDRFDILPLDGSSGFVRLDLGADFEPERGTHTYDISLKIIDRTVNKIEYWAWFTDTQWNGLLEFTA